MKRRTVLIKYMQYRAEELKKIGEQRAELMEQMNAIVNKAEEEKRAMEDSEKTEFDELEEKVRAGDRNDEVCEFDEFDENLRHIIVKRDRHTLRKNSVVDLNRAAPQKGDYGKIDYRERERI